MRKILGLIILLATVSANCSQAQVTWMKSFGSTDADEGSCVVSDSYGNVYFAGSFKGPMMMGTFAVNYIGGQDGLIAKLDSAGNVLWVQSFGGWGDDKPASLALTRDGFLLVAGSFYDSCSFGNNMIYGHGYTDAFVAKIDTSNGQFVWIKNAGNPYGYEEATCLCVDSLNQIWLGGNFSYWMEAGSDTLLSNGAFDFFILKYNQSGTLLYSSSYGSTGFDNITSLSSDAGNRIYLCGSFSDTLSMDGFNIVSAGYLDFYWASIDNSFSAQWLKRGGGPSTENVSCIRAYRDGSFYLLGWVQDTAWIEGQMLQGGEGDIFLASFNADQSLRWVKEGYNLNANELAREIVIDKYDDVYLAGQSNFVIQRLEEAGGRNESTEKACPYGDLVFLKYDSSGTLLWMEHTLGSNYNIANSVTVNNNGSCFVAAYFSDSIWIGPFLNIGLGASDLLLFRYHDPTFIVNTDAGKISRESIKANVYPNPADGNFYITLFSENDRRPCAIKLFSTQGIKTSEWRIVLSEGMNVLEINADMPAGFYFISLECDNTEEHLKLIIQ